MQDRANEPKDSKQFPDGMVPLGEAPFSFACHPGLPCFTRCCRGLTLFLYPYDILCLKKRLGIGSEEFLHTYAGVIQGPNPFFPSLILRMQGDDDKRCPFLDPASGCLVYRDRPAACRTYPLERALDRSPERGREREYYFLTGHSYCLGHREKQEWTVKEWIKDQRLAQYNAMDDLWAEMDTLFAGNPWQGEGAAGPLQQLAFMVCYNIDCFRLYVAERDLLKLYGLEKFRKRAIESDDTALLKFGFDWLQLVLAGRPTLRPRG